MEKINALVAADNYITQNGGEFMGEVVGNRCYWVWNNGQNFYFFWAKGH